MNMIELIWSFVWFGLSFFVFIYKGIVLPYPTSSYAFEYTFIFILEIVVLCKIFMGNMGNKTERPGMVAWFLLLSILVLVGYIYYFFLQIYSLVIDAILFGVALVIAIIQLLFALLYLIRLCRAVSV